MSNIKWDAQYKQAIEDGNWDLVSQILGDLPERKEQDLTDAAQALEQLFTDVEQIGD